MARGVFGAHSLHLHVIHDVTCFSVCCLFLFCLLPLSLSRLYLFSPACSLSCSSTSMTSEPPRVETTALTHNEEYCPVAIYNPLTGYESKLFDNFDYSETSAMIFQDESGDKDTEPSYDEIIGKALSSPLIVHNPLTLVSSLSLSYASTRCIMPPPRVIPASAFRSVAKVWVAARHGGVLPLSLISEQLTEPCFCHRSPLQAYSRHRTLRQGLTPCLLQF